MEHTRNAIHKSVGMGWFILAMIVVAAVQSHWVQIYESRPYRDITGLTPFHSVLFETSLTEDNREVITGVFVKRRCVLEQIIAYTVTGDNTYRAFVDLSPEDGGVLYSRPPSKHTQTFGPWIITSIIGQPDSWELYAVHMCPEGISTNLFAKGPWG